LGTGENDRLKRLAQRPKPAEDFFIWIRRNPLKSPNSAKEIQGNPSLFPWFSLVFLGFVWRPESSLADGASAQIGK
jgi:hypothetical protein